MNKKELLHLIKKGEGQYIEFKDNFNKEAIETLIAFANSSGGRIFLGVNDKGELKGINIKKETIKNWLNEIKTKTEPFLLPDFELVEVNKKQIVILEIKEFPLKPVSFKERVFVRKGNSNQKCSLSEISEIYLKTKRSSWDFYLNEEYSLDDLNTEKILKVINLIEKNLDKKLGNVEEFLIKYDLISKDKTPTNAAVLLFSKKLLRETDIQIGLFQDEITIKKNKIIRNDLISEVEEVMDFVKAYILKEFIITGSPYREERWQYPLDAIRELVINAIIHRDYRGVHSQFKIFPGKLEFWNSGKIPYDLSIEDIMEGKKKSEPRNKLVAEVFRDAGLIERYGSGVKRVREKLKEYGLVDLKISEIQSGFNIEVFAEKLNGTLNGTLNDLLKEIEKKSGIQANELAISLNRPLDTIKKQIKKLVDKNLIQRKGSKKTGGYFAEKINSLNNRVEGVLKDE